MNQTTNTPDYTDRDAARYVPGIMYDRAMAENARLSEQLRQAQAELRALGQLIAAAQQAGFVWSNEGCEHNPALAAEIQAGCDEYHAHETPDCCDSKCWCRAALKEGTNE